MNTAIYGSIREPFLRVWTIARLNTCGEQERRTHCHGDNPNDEYKMLEKYLDAYELKARVAPGLIVALPMLVVAFYTAPVLRSWPFFTASGICGLALVYALGLVVRACGRAIEEELWNRWGGPPSTRFMRHRNTAFGADLKKSIATALAREFSFHLLSSEDEAKYPERSDKVIFDAFRKVRTFLRQHDANGLWSKLNAEYGFCRNLLGSRALWLVISLLSTGFAVAYSIRIGGNALNPASAVASLSLICSIYVGWFVLPELTRRVGESYAETAWLQFEHLSAEKSLKVSAG
jgi:hypothetical protein